MIILKFIIKYKRYRLAQDLLLDIFSPVGSEIVKKQCGPMMYLSDRECASCVQDKRGWVLVCITDTTEDIRKQQQQRNPNQCHVSLRLHLWWWDSVCARNSSCYLCTVLLRLVWKTVLRVTWISLFSFCFKNRTRTKYDGKYKAILVKPVTLYVT